MPLPDDKEMIAQCEAVIAQCDAAFGLHPGFRPAHARGLMLTGTFTPTNEAAALSIAPHFSNPSTPVTVRFSSFTGIPQIPDNDPNAQPRGFAIRFHLGERVHTDIVGHSADGFPARSGPEFLEFLTALASSPPGTPSPSPIESFIGSHPATLAFVQIPKPAPTSFAHEGFFGLNAMKFINSDGAGRYGRYSIVPDAGLEHIADEESLKSKSTSYLYDELKQRITNGHISFHLRVQLAEEGDVVDDVSVHWPQDRTVVDLGKIELTALDPNDDKNQKRIIFDPVPRIKGIEPSADPLIEFRAAIYLMSGRRRRAAPEV